MKEKWKDIPGYEGRYQASNLGRIKSLARMRRTKGGGMCPVKERIMKLTPHSFGYSLVGLYHSSGKLKLWGVHQLVLLTFVGPCPVGMEACHAPDPTPTNNRVSNLRWDTHANNNRDRAYASGEDHHCALFTNKQVREMRRLYSEEGMNQTQIAKLFGTCQQRVSYIVRHKNYKTA